MISITLGQGVSKITIPAIIHISNLIYEAQKESGISFGKAVINYDEITFYKFALKVGRTRFEISDFMCSLGGVIDYIGCYSPTITDLTMYKLVERAVCR
jgi:hypothetical protein